MIEVRLNPDVEPTGSDLAVVNAARRSFNKRSEWVYEKYDLPVGRGQTYSATSYRKTLKPEDRRLLQFLARGMTAKDFDVFLEDVVETVDYVPMDGDHTDYDTLTKLLWQWRNNPTHDTPFNHCFLSFEVKTPIFLARQLVKHEYLIMSEFSRRYITDDLEFYQPKEFRKAAENKKQGSSSETTTWGVGGHDQVIRKSVMVYKDMIEMGVAPEEARMVLPQSTMTEWTWSGTLGAFAKMCTLRLHSDAQSQARVVAEKVYEQLLRFYPVSAKALVEGADIV